MRNTELILDDFFNPDFQTGFLGAVRDLGKLGQKRNVVMFHMQMEV